MTIDYDRIKVKWKFQLAHKGRELVHLNGWSYQEMPIKLPERLDIYQKVNIDNLLKKITKPGVTEFVIANPVEVDNNVMNLVLLMPAEDNKVWKSFVQFLSRSNSVGVAPLCVDGSAAVFVIPASCVASVHMFPKIDNVKMPDCAFGLLHFPNFMLDVKQVPILKIKQENVLEDDKEVVKKELHRFESSYSNALPSIEAGSINAKVETNSTYYVSEKDLSDPMYNPVSVREEALLKLEEYCAVDCVKIKTETIKSYFNDQVGYSCPSSADNESQDDMPIDYSLKSKTVAADNETIKKLEEDPVNLVCDNSNEEIYQRETEDLSVNIAGEIDDKITDQGQHNDQPMTLIVIKPEENIPSTDVPFLIYNECDQIKEQDKPDAQKVFDLAYSQSDTDGNNNDDDAKEKGEVNSQSILSEGSTFCQDEPGFSEDNLNNTKDMDETLTGLVNQNSTPEFGERIKSIKVEKDSVKAVCNSMDILKNAYVGFVSDSVDDEFLLVNKNKNKKNAETKSANRIESCTLAVNSHKNNEIHDSINEIGDKYVVTNSEKSNIEICQATDDSCKIKEVAKPIKKHGKESTELFSECHYPANTDECLEAAPSKTIVSLDMPGQSCKKAVKSMEAIDILEPIKNSTKQDLHKSVSVNTNGSIIPRAESIIGSTVGGKPAELSGVIQELRQLESIFKGKSVVDQSKGLDLVKNVMHWAENLVLNMNEESNVETESSDNDTVKALSKTQVCEKIQPVEFSTESDCSQVTSSAIFNENMDNIGSIFAAEVLSKKFNIDFQVNGTTKYLGSSKQSNKETESSGNAAVHSSSASERCEQIKSLVSNQSDTETESSGNGAVNVSSKTQRCNKIKSSLSDQSEKVTESSGNGAVHSSSTAQRCETISSLQLSSHSDKVTESSGNGAVHSSSTTPRYETIESQISKNARLNAKKNHYTSCTLNSINLPNKPVCNTYNDANSFGQGDKELNDKNVIKMSDSLETENIPLPAMKNVNKAKSLCQGDKELNVKNVMKRSDSLETENIPLPAMKNVNDAKSLGQSDKVSTVKYMKMSDTLQIENIPVPAMKNVNDAKSLGQSDKESTVEIIMKSSDAIQTENSTVYAMENINDEKSCDQIDKELTVKKIMIRSDTVQNEKSTVSAVKNVNTYRKDQSGLTQKHATDIKSKVFFSKPGLFKKGISFSLKTNSPTVLMKNVLKTRFSSSEDSDFSDKGQSTNEVSTQKCVKTQIVQPFMINCPSKSPSMKRKWDSTKNCYVDSPTKRLCSERQNELFTPGKIITAGSFNDIDMRVMNNGYCAMNISAVFTGSNSQIDTDDISEQPSKRRVWMSTTDKIKRRKSESNFSGPFEVQQNSIPVNNRRRSDSYTFVFGKKGRKRIKRDSSSYNSDSNTSSDGNWTFPSMNHEQYLIHLERNSKVITNDKRSLSSFQSWFPKVIACQNSINLRLRELRRKDKDKLHQVSSENIQQFIQKFEHYRALYEFFYVKIFVSRFVKSRNERLSKRMSEKRRRRKAEDLKYDLKQVTISLKEEMIHKISAELLDLIITAEMECDILCQKVTSAV